MTKPPREQGFRGGRYRNRTCDLFRVKTGHRGPIAAPSAGFPHGIASRVGLWLQAWLQNRGYRAERRGTTLSWSAFPYPVNPSATASAMSDVVRCP
jgi:hypothetical protein